MTTGAEFSLLNKVTNDLKSVVNYGAIDRMPYGTFWLRGGALPGRPQSVNSLQHHISYCAWYPQPEGVTGLLINGHVLPADEQALNDSDLGLLEDEIATDTIKYGQMRARFERIAAEEGRGGFLTDAQEFCAERALPFGSVAIWRSAPADTFPSYMSFHPTILVSPEIALKSLKFALWQEREKNQSAPSSENR